MGRKRRRYTRSMFHRAEKAMAEMAIHEETIRVWTRTMKEIGEANEKRVLAFEVTEDGKVKVEFEPFSHEHSESPPPNPNAGSELGGTQAP